MFIPGWVGRMRFLSFSAKAMSAGKPEGALSDEEARAVSQARTETLGRKALAERVGEERGSGEG